MPTPTLSPDMLSQLAAHPLKGNVRELENLLHRAVALSDGDALHADFAPSVRHDLESIPSAAPAPAPVAATPADLQGYLDQLEREILIKALHETGFNRTAAAARLGLSLRQIRYRMSRLGITEPSDNDTDDAAG